VVTETRGICCRHCLYLQGEEHLSPVRISFSYSGPVLASRRQFYWCVKVIIDVPTVHRTIRTLKNTTTFWDITPCSPSKVNRRFEKICRLRLQGRRVSRARNQCEAGSKQSPVSRWGYYSAMKMEVTFFSEVSVDFQRTTRRYIPEDGALRNHRCKNLQILQAGRCFSKTDNVCIFTTYFSFTGSLIVWLDVKDTHLSRLVHRTSSTSRLSLEMCKRLDIRLTIAVQYGHFEVKKYSFPWNRTWRPIVFWDVEAPTFCLDSRVTDGGKVVSLTSRKPFTPKEDSWYSFLSGWVDPRAIVRLEGLGKLKKSTSSGLDPATFRLLA
jgi:hypothetical protein